MNMMPNNVDFGITALLPQGADLVNRYSHDEIMFRSSYSPSLFTTGERLCENRYPKWWVFFFSA